VDPTGRLELAKRLDEPLATDAERVAKSFLGRRRAAAERCEDTSVKTLVDTRHGHGECEMRCAILGAQFKRKRVERSRIALLDDEGECVGLSAEVEVRVAPCMEVARAAETKPGLRLPDARLTRVVDHEDGEVVLALEVAEVGEDARHLERRVLVDSVESHEGIEHEQPGLEFGDRHGQALLIAGRIETKTGREDEVKR
jgi:hypothetical protein